jgi:hypothetical protein
MPRFVGRPRARGRLGVTDGPGAARSKGGIVMRFVVAVLAGLGCLAGAAAGEKVTEPAKRYGVEADLKTYPQGTPQETLASVLKAVEDKRVNYLVAQLANPKFVDQRLKETGGRFDDLVQGARAKLVDDPGPAKLLRRFLKEGDWQVSDDAASVRLKDVRDRGAYFRRENGRWFLENRFQPETDKK